MLTDAHAGRFKAEICWSLDRVSRRGIAEVAGIISKLDAAGVALVSVQEPWCDSSGPVRELLVAIFAWIARQERDRLVERTRAGMDRARRGGKHIGRPPVRPGVVEDALRRIASGERVVDVARSMGLDPSTLRKYCRLRRA